MDKKMLFIFNPLSGKGQIKGCLCDVIDIFTKGGYDVTVHPTQCQNDAFKLIEHTAADYDIIVVSGGDGTLNEAVHGILTLPPDVRPPIGYIPSGTTNDFAASRGIPKEPVKAAQQIINGKIKKEDIGLLNQNTFNYVAAFGAFTDVSYDTPQGAKNLLGHAAYVVEGIKRIPSIDAIHIHLKCDECEINDYFSVGCILNSTSMAGINFDGKFDIRFDDGLFEILLIKKPVTLMQAQEIIWAFFTGEDTGDQIRLVRTSYAEIEFDTEIKWTLDGEYGGSFKSVKMNVLDKAVSFVL